MSALIVINEDDIVEHDGGKINHTTHLFVHSF